MKEPMFTDPDGQRTGQMTAHQGIDNGKHVITAAQRYLVHYEGQAILFAVWPAEWWTEAEIQENAHARRLWNIYQLAPGNKKEDAPWLYGGVAPADQQWLQVRHDDGAWYPIPSTGYALPGHEEYGSEEIELRVFAPSGSVEDMVIPEFRLWLKVDPEPLAAEPRKPL